MWGLCVCTGLDPLCPGPAGHSELNGRGGVISADRLPSNDLVARCTESVAGIRREIVGKRNSWTVRDCVQREIGVLGVARLLEPTELILAHPEIETFVMVFTPEFILRRDCSRIFSRCY